MPKKTAATSKVGSKTSTRAGTYRCRNCSAPHGGAYSADLCADCLLKAAGGSLRLSAGQYLCAACNGAVLTDPYGAIRCEHWCFTTDARSAG